MTDNLDDQIADRIIEVMNRMLESDQIATAAILRTRHNCNQRLADDPTIQVAGGREPPTVGLIGILNGLAGVLPATSERPGWGRVTGVFEVMCPVHGEGLKANDGCTVGSPCMADGCAAVLDLGSLVRFERTEKTQPISYAAPIVHLAFHSDDGHPLDGKTVEFALPENHERLSTAVHIDCMRPVFREADGSRMRTSDDCKCHDEEES